MDFFYLEIEAPRTVRISLADIPRGTDYDLYLVTGEEDILSSSSNSGEEEEYLQYTTSSVGVFYVLVLPFNDFSRTESYTLHLQLSPAPTPTGTDSYEPNDTFEQAVGPLALGQAYQSYVWDEGDTDNYLVILDESQTVAIELSDIAAAADYDLFLYDQAGKLLGSSKTVLERERIEHHLEAGAYYVTIRSFAGFSRNEPYTLQVALVEP